MSPSPLCRFLAFTTLAIGSGTGIAAQERAVPSGEFEQRMALLERLAERGRGRHLEEVWEAAGPLPSARVRIGKRQEAVSRALVAILERDGRSVFFLKRDTTEVPEDLRAVLVSATREALGSRVIELWPAWLEAGETYELAVLSEIPRLGIAVLSHQRETLARNLRPRLSAMHPEVRALTAVALGQLLDGDSLAALLELLEDPDAQVVRKAGWALARIAGVDLGGEVAPWRAWVQEQGRLEAEEVPELLEAVRTGTEPEALEALGELRLCLASRHRLTELLGPELWNPSQRIASCVAETLGELASPDAVPELLAALERPELLVQSSSWRALREITGFDLAFEPVAWRDRLLR